MTETTQSAGAVLPVYALDPHGGVTVLYEGPLSASLASDCSETIYAGKGRVLFQLAPEPHLPWEVIASVEHDSSRLVSPSLMKVLVPKFSELTFGDPLATAQDSDMPNANQVGARFWGGLPRTSIGDPANLSELRYHLVGFPLKLGSSEVIYPNGQRWQGRISLPIGDWEVDIDAWPDWAKIQDDNLKEGSFPVSLVRMCRIRRNEGLSLSAASSEIESIRFALTLFLSFVSGQSVGSALPVGFAQNGEKQFVERGSTNVDPIAQFESWYDFRFPDRLSPLFERFIERLSETLWQKPLVTAIRSYATANRLRAGFAFGLATGFMALESLTWMILVRRESWLDPDGYGKLTAADRLRLLLKWASIPLEVPPYLGLLEAMALNQKMEGPEVLSWIRNRIVHPDKKDQLEYGPVRDAWKLSLWYLELLLLRLFDYEGPYRSRADSPQSIGESRLVPWAVP